MLYVIHAVRERENTKEMRERETDRQIEREIESDTWKINHVHWILKYLIKCIYKLISLNDKIFVLVQTQSTCR